MIKCPHCGKELERPGKYCPGCGRALNAPEAVPPPAPSPAAAPLPGEPDMSKLLALLPDLELKTTDLEIPVPDIDVNAEIERLTQLNLEEQLKIINQLAQQIKTRASEQTKQ